MRALLGLLAALLTVASFACYTTTTQTVDVDKRSRSYSADPDRLVEAAVSYFEAEGFPILDIDRESRRISTDFKEEWSFAGNRRSKISITIRDAAAGSELVAVIVLEVFESRSDSWKTYNMTAGQAAERYEEFFQEIKGRL